MAKKKIPGDTAIVIYRVIQEALTNITKHAKAQKVSVRLYSDKNKVHLDITDDGVGFDVDKVSKRKGKLKIGIQGMRERVESLGGEFMITSAPKRRYTTKSSPAKKIKLNIPFPFISICCGGHLQAKKCSLCINSDRSLAA